MLSRNYLKHQDLTGYLQGYNRNTPESAEIWSKQQSAIFEPGMILFCLEKVGGAAIGTTNRVGGGSDESDDSYRVRDLCIVVGKDNRRALVVNITANAYELRFLEVLMFEKARKAILDEKDFLYIAARPAQALSEEKIREIEQAGAVYAKGGSRRSLTDGSIQEPALALLAVLGANLSPPGAGKQLLDIGHVCQMLIGANGQQDDPNKTALNTSFVPISNVDGLGRQASKREPVEDDRYSIWQAPSQAETTPNQPQQASLPESASEISDALPLDQTYADATDAGSKDAGQTPATKRAKRDVDLFNKLYARLSQGAQPVSDDQPQSNLAEEQPQAGLTESQPQTGLTEPQPQTGLAESQPQANLAESQPQAGLAESQPQTGLAESQPQTGLAESQPQANWAEEQPQTASAEVPPQAGSAEDQPQSNWAEEQPQTASAEVPPQAGLAEDQPQSNWAEEQPQTASAEVPPQAGSVEEQVPLAPAVSEVSLVPWLSPPPPAVEESADYWQSSKPWETSDAEIGSSSADSSSSSDYVIAPEESYKHLAEAISGLAKAENDAAMQPYTVPLDISVPPSAALFSAPTPVEPEVTQPTSSEAPTPASSSQPLATDFTNALAEASGSAEAAESAAGDAQSSDSPGEQPSPAAPILSKASQQPAVQDPRLVMNEMLMLMNKLEQQVAQASRRLNARAEAIKQRLHKEVEDHIVAASRIEEQNQTITTDLTNRLSKNLDDVWESVRQHISDTAAHGRYTIKQLLSTSQNQIEERQNVLRTEIQTACDKFKVDSESFLVQSQAALDTLVKSRTSEIEQMIASISQSLNDCHDQFAAKINARLNRFKERMANESDSVSRSLARNVGSMFEEIDGSWDRASEKLKSSQSDFERTIAHTVRNSQLAGSQRTKQILIDSISPSLRERKIRLRALINELTARFHKRSSEQTMAQAQGFETSLANAREQLDALVIECLANIDAASKAQQIELESIFKQTSERTETLIGETDLAIDRAYNQIVGAQSACKQLAENASLEGDSQLTEERNKTNATIQKARQESTLKLQGTIEESCAHLEQLNQTVQSQLNSKRLEETQAVRECAELGLARLREAIQEAFAAVQAARENFME